MKVLKRCFKIFRKTVFIFKNELNQLSVETLSPITKEMRKLLDDKVYLEEILNNGADKANSIAEPILKDTKEIVGFY